MKTNSAHIFLIPGISLLMLLGCGDGTTTQQNVPENAISSEVVENPASASGNEKGKVPAYQFADTIHDFGRIVQGEKVSFAFRFTNSGNGDLIIRAAQGSCGCTVPEWPKEPVKPGEGGIINVTFNSEGKEGLQNKTITLIANTIPNTYVLTVTGEVIKPEANQ
ncbi:MAG TPA: DUF1573 domain-containing protein [Bacteroidia bacterium]|nr:DUF1573 domain-containing protein [Bacteroidia bacterium]